MTLTRDAILGANDIRIEKLAVPEWGGEVYVKGMTGSERDRFELSIMQIRGKSQTINMQNVRAKLASVTVCDEKGNLLFAQADIEVLGGKSASALQRVFNLARHLSGLTDEDVKELTQELEEAPLEDSASG